MVRAILAGAKTQTRRVVKTDTRPQSDDTLMRGFPPNPTNVRFCGMYAKCDAPAGSRSVSFRVPCPFGWLGDRLWVRETFREYDHCWTQECMASAVQYQSDFACRSSVGGSLPDAVAPEKGWTPSIHMPRWASRLTLEITSIRIERLQDISEGDAKAEGVKAWQSDNYRAAHNIFDGTKLAYAELWNEINGVGACALNPWVWVIAFKRITP